VNAPKTEPAPDPRGYRSHRDGAVNSRSWSTTRCSASTAIRWSNRWGRIPTRISKPELTARQMLSLGVFGGKYMTDGANEFPGDWFAEAKLSPGRHDATLNYFGVPAGQVLSVWREKGWIHPDDPRAWFQWYCRYYFGCRLGGEDARQIKRWKAMQRSVRQIQGSCEPCDLRCRRRQRQALLQWARAYDSRKI
jgi:hypothetical protein